MRIGGVNIPGFSFDLSVQNIPTIGDILAAVNNKIVAAMFGELPDVVKMLIDKVRLPNHDEQPEHDLNYECALCAPLSSC